LNDAEQPEQAETDPDLIGSACVPINTNMRLDSLELRVSVLEAQHVWLRIEQLEAQARAIQKLAEFLVGSDG
jgi:hypothetical protein